MTPRIANFIKRRKEGVIVLQFWTVFRRHRGGTIAGGGIDRQAQRLLNQRSQGLALMARLSLCRAKHTFINVQRCFHVPIVSRRLLGVNSFRARPG